MRVQPGKLKEITFYLGGHPERMEEISSIGKGSYVLTLEEHPTRLGRQLVSLGDWLKEMSFRFPDDDVDCWIEIGEDGEDGP